MNTKKIAVNLTAIEDELIDDILATPISEIERELNQHTDSLTESIEKTRSFINENVVLARKKILVEARTAIEQQNNLIDKSITTVEQAQEFIFQMIASGTAQNNQLTSAFREGENIPDEDLIAIANEILELVNSNEAKD